MYSKRVSNHDADLEISAIVGPVAINTWGSKNLEASFWESLS